MATELDLREESPDEQRDQIFARLDTLDSDETIELIADLEAEVHLYQYQIKRAQLLHWEQLDADPWKVRVTKTEPLDEGAFSEFDVREMPPQRRHQVLLDTFDDLEPGEGFVLVNDHDPKPLYHELRSTRGETFEWEYLSEGSQEWKVEIVKTDQSEAGDDDVITKFDVRTIPKQERHPTIHHRYGMIPDGGTMEIVAPHEPRPLHREFQQQYGQSFTWDVVEKEPGRCRVQITKENTSDTTTASIDDEPSADQPSLETQTELDVRDLPPAKRHEEIFEAYESLQRGEAFILVNDHDPKPLYHQFEAEAGNEFRWEYRQKEPGEFRVIIGKAERSDSEADVDTGASSPF